ncbi:MAG: 2-phosphosulfolactate phosphatase, partial [Ralstonia mannitolilytica]
EDVTIAAQTDVSDVAPMLVEGAFRNVNRKTERAPQDFFGASLRPAPVPPSHRNPPLPH